MRIVAQVRVRGLLGHQLTLVDLSVQGTFTDGFAKVSCPSASVDRRQPLLGVICDSMDRCLEAPGMRIADA